MAIRPKLQSLILCDLLRKEDSGKFIAVGIYHDSIILASHPEAPRQFEALLGIWRLPLGAHDLTLRLRAPSKKVVVEVTGQFIVENENLSVFLPVPIGPVLFSEMGVYSLTVAIDGARIHSHKILVDIAVPAGGAADTPAEPPK